MDIHLLMAAFEEKKEKKKNTNPKNPNLLVKSLLLKFVFCANRLVS